MQSLHARGEQSEAGVRAKSGGEGRGGGGVERRATRAHCSAGPQRRERPWYAVISITMQYSPPALSLLCILSIPPADPAVPFCGFINIAL